MPQSPAPKEKGLSGVKFKDTVDMYILFVECTNHKNLYYNLISTVLFKQTVPNNQTATINNKTLREKTFAFS